VSVIEFRGACHEGALLEKSYVHLQRDT
jgi:hypothetical protein